MTVYTRLELVQAVADVRHVLDHLNAQVIDGGGRMVQHLHARREEGRQENAGRQDDWGTWTDTEFRDACLEEVLDAVIYQAERCRRVREEAA